MSSTRSNLNINKLSTENNNQARQRHMEINGKTVILDEPYEPEQRFFIGSCWL